MEASSATAGEIAVARPRALGLLAKLRFPVYAAGIAFAAVHLLGPADVAKTSAPARPVTRVAGRTAQRQPMFVEVANGRVHSVAADVVPTCLVGDWATVHVSFGSSGPLGIRQSGGRFHDQWTSGGVHAKLAGRIGAGGAAAGTVSLTGRFAGNVCRTGSVAWRTSPAA